MGIKIRKKSYFNFYKIFKTWDLGFRVMGVCGHCSRRGILLKETCAKSCKNLLAKSQHYSSYNFRNFSVHTDGQTDMADQEYIHSIGPETLPVTYFTLYFLGTG